MSIKHVMKRAKSARKSHLYTPGTRIKFNKSSPTRKTKSMKYNVGKRIKF